MKKLLSVVLAIVLVLSLAACGAGNSPAGTNLTQDKLKGTWSMTLNISDLMDVAGDALAGTMGMEGMSAFFDSIPDSLTLTALMVFDGEGNCSSMISKSDFNKFYQDVMNAILTEETMYAIYAAQGMDKATVDAALAAQGTSISAVINMTKLQMSSMNIADTLVQSGGAVAKGDYLCMSQESEYTIDGNTVVMDGTKLEYDGTNLVMKEVSSEDGDTPDLSGLLPLTIKRVSDKVDY